MALIAGAQPPCTSALSDLMIRSARGLPGLSVDGGDDEPVGGYVYRHVIGDGPPQLLNVFDGVFVDATEPTVSADGQRVMFRTLDPVPGNSCAVQCLQVFDADVGAVTSPADRAFWGQGFDPLLSRDGSAVIVSGLGSTSYVDLGTGDKTRLDPPGAGSFTFQALSGDGTTVIFTSVDAWDAPDDEESDLGPGTFLMDTDTLEVQRVSDNRSFRGLSADGATMYELRDGSLVAIDLTDGEVRYLVTPDSRYQLSNWRVAGDGGAVAFESRSDLLGIEEGAPNVYLAPLEPSAVDAPSDGE